MISLLEAATGADLSLVKAVAAFITFFNSIAGMSDGHHPDPARRPAWTA